MSYVIHSIKAEWNSYTEDKNNDLKLQVESICMPSYSAKITLIILFCMCGRFEFMQTNENAFFSSALSHC